VRRCLWPLFTLLILVLVSPPATASAHAVVLAGAAAPSIVEADSLPVEVLYGMLNALGYLGLFCLVGFTVFDLLVARTATVGRRLAQLAGLVAVGAYMLLVPVTAVRLRGLGLGALIDPGVLTTGWSGGAVTTLIFAAVGVALMFDRVRLPSRQGLWVGLAGAGAALVSVLFVGHTQTFGPQWLVMGADVVHAATAAVWLGGLLALIIHLTRARRLNGSPAEAAVVLGRFSTLAGGVLLLLGITGTILGVVIVGSIPALVGSDYGHLLLAKLAVVAVIAGIAAWNRFGLLPRLARDRIKGQAWRGMLSAVRVEVVGVVLVIGLTSALTMQNPGASIAAPTSTLAASEVLSQDGTPLRADLGAGALTGRFSPGKAGVNVITFELTDAGGAPIVPIALPTLTVSEPNLSLGPLVAVVEPGDMPGSYRAVLTVPVAGQWKITAAVRVNELEQPAAVVDVVVVD
jgi:copper transport protein